MRPSKSPQNVIGAKFGEGPVVEFSPPASIYRALAIARQASEAKEALKAD